jgi:hypothetical protein
MFDVRNWERFQFLLDCEHQTVSVSLLACDRVVPANDAQCLQNKTILQRALPPYLKLSIAKTIENQLFSKVMSKSTSVVRYMLFPAPSDPHDLDFCRFLFSLDLLELVKSGPC